MSVLTFIAALGGWSLLALAMTRHRRQLGLPPAGPRRRILLRAMAAGLLGISFAASARCWGLAEGTVAWFLVLTASAFVLVLALTWVKTASILYRRSAGN